MKRFHHHVSGSARLARIAGVIAFVGALGAAREASACGSGETEVYRSTKSVWCVNDGIVAKYGTFPKEFFPYGDDVIDELVRVFNVKAEGVYTYEAGAESGGAHTGSECCGLGVTVTGDAFYNNGYGATGYWGYLLSLHEMINDWTGQVTSGWPTDFWADHISAYPNSLDWHIMQTLGEKNNDANLKKAATAQKGRFYPGGDSEDIRVEMFDNIFDLPGFGFDGYSRTFSYFESDKLKLDELGVPNPDVKRTEYVMAYLGLGAGQSVTSIMQAAHVGDGVNYHSAQDTPYTVNQDHIDAIANAHCSINAAAAEGKDVSSDKSAFLSGNYAGVSVTGVCGSTCPSECACDKAANRCVAPWLGEKPPGTGTGGATGAGGSGMAGSGTGSSTSGSGSSSGVGGSVTGTGGDAMDKAPGSGDDSSGCSCSSVGQKNGTAGALFPWASVLGAVSLGAFMMRRRQRMQ